MAAPFGTTHDFGGTVTSGVFGWNSGTRDFDMHEYVTNLTPTSQKVFGLLGEDDTESASPEWMITTLSAIDETDAFTEGSDYTYTDPNIPTRVQNVLRHQRKTAEISGRSMKDKHFKAIGNMMAYQTNIRAMELMRDMGWALINSRRVNSTEATGTRFRGIRESLIRALQFTDVAAATGVTEALFKETMLFGVWNAGFEPDIVVTGAVQQNEIDTFPFVSTNAVQIRADEMKRISWTKEVITPYGTVKVYTERDAYLTKAVADTALLPGGVLPAGEDATYVAASWVFALDSRFWKKSFHRRIWQEEPPRDGDRWRNVVQCDWTMKDLAPTAGWILQDLDTTP